MFQSTLEEALTEWGKPTEKEAVSLLKNVVNADPALQEFAQNDPDLSMVVNQSEEDNASIV